MDPLLLRPDVMAVSDGHLVVLSLRAGATLSMLDAVIDATKNHRAHYGESARYFTLLIPSLKMPDADTRERIYQLYLTEGAPGKTAIMVVGSGFWVAAIRGFLAGASLLSKKAGVSVTSVREGLEYLELSPAEALRLERPIELLQEQHRLHAEKNAGASAR